VGQNLVVGVSVDGGHQTADHTQFLVQRSNQGSQTVGGARCVGDNGIGALQNVVVHAVHDRGVHILATGGRDDDFLGTGLNVLTSLFLGGESAGTFQHYVHTQLSPRQGQRIALAQQADTVAVDHQMIAIQRHISVETAMHGVIASQVFVDLGTARGVDGHDLDIVFFAVLVVGTQDHAADTTITIDCD